MGGDQCAEFDTQKRQTDPGEIPNRFSPYHAGLAILIFAEVWSILLAPLASRARAIGTSKQLWRGLTGECRRVGRPWVLGTGSNVCICAS